jgi:hypothetical protein
MQFKSCGVAMGYDQMFHAIQELLHSYGTMTRWSMYFKSYSIAMGHVKINPIQELWHSYGTITRCSMQFKSYDIALG